jgi:hypothetical protein
MYKAPRIVASLDANVVLAVAVGGHGSCLPSEECDD